MPVGLFLHPAGFFSKKADPFSETGPLCNTLNGNKHFHEKYDRSAMYLIPFFQVLAGHRCLNLCLERFNFTAGDKAVLFRI